MSIQQTNSPQTRSEEPSPAEMYQEFLVPGIHARWTPVFLGIVEPQRDERVIDLACGTGIVARNVAPSVDSTVVAVDASPDMLDVAQRLPAPDGGKIEWHEGDACDLSFTDGEFDVALCQQGFQFLDEPARAAREMHRVVGAGGRAAVSVWQGLDRHPLYAAISRAEARYLDRPIDVLSTPFTMGDANELRGMFDGAGFRDVEIVQESHEVRFPSPAKFVTLTLLAAASIIPESEMDDEARAEMVKSISGEVEPTLQKYIDGDDVAFPMHAHIVVARA